MNEEVLYKITALYSEQKKDYPDKIRQSQDDDHWGTTYINYDFKNHRYLYCYVSDNFNLHDEITNLQKENEDLKKLKERYQLKKEIYKQRNEKAIEWCKCVINSKTTVGKLPNGNLTDMGYCLNLAEPLLNILQGGDEE